MEWYGLEAEHEPAEWCELAAECEQAAAVEHASSEEDVPQRQADGLLLEQLYALD